MNGMITHLNPKEIFVFGSNNKGNHAGGAAAYAVEHFGAVQGQREGLQGQSYALPTISRDMKPLSLRSIHRYVYILFYIASSHPELKFLLTKVGCGIAGYSEEDIKPLFKNAPSNVIKPEGW